MKINLNHPYVFCTVIFLCAYIGGILISPSYLKEAEALDYASSKQKFISKRLLPTKTDMDFQIHIDPNDYHRYLNFKNKEEFQKEINSILSNPVDFSHFIKLEFLLSQWAQYAPLSAYQYIRNTKNEYLYLLENTFLHAWASQNPESLAQSINEGLIPLEKNALSLEYASLFWLKSSPDDALKWIFSLSDDQRKTGLLSAISTLSSEYPEKMDMFVQRIDAKDLSDPVILNSMASQWVLNDPQKALSWISQLPKEQLSMLPDYSHIDPSMDYDAILKIAQNQANLLADKIKNYPDSIQSQLWEDIILKQAASLGLTELAFWIDAHMPASAQENFHVSFNESEMPLNQLEYIISRLSQNPMRNRYINALINSKGLDSKNYPEALTFMHNASPENLSLLFKKWASQDPTNAKSWLDSSSLFSEEQKQSIKQSLPRPFTIRKKDL